MAAPNNINKTIRVSEDVLALIEAEQARTGQSLSSVIRTCVTLQLKTKKGTRDE